MISGGGDVVGERRWIGGRSGASYKPDGKGGEHASEHEPAGCVSGARVTSRAKAPKDAFTALKRRSPPLHMESDIPALDAKRGGSAGPSRTAWRHVDLCRVHDRAAVLSCG